MGGGGGPGRWTGCSTPGPQSGGSSGRPGCPDSAAFETPADPASYGNNLVLKNILCAYRHVTVPVRLSMQLRHDSAYKFIRSVSRFFLEGGGSQRKRGWGRLVAIIIANPHHMVNVCFFFQSSSIPARGGSPHPSPVQALVFKCFEMIKSVKLKISKMAQTDLTPKNRILQT